MSGIDDDFKRQLHQLAIARSDLTEAIYAARYILERVTDMKDPLWVPLQDAVVVAYARPFSGNRPYGRLPEEYSQFENHRMRELHEELIELRNKTIAHSDADIRRLIVVPPRTNLGPVQTEGGGISLTTQKLPPARFREIETLCLDVGRRINTNVDAMTAQLLASDLPPHPFDLLTGEPE